MADIASVLTSVSKEGTTMRKTITAALLILCMFATLLFAGCSNAQKNRNDNTTAAQASKDGAASAYGEKKSVQTYNGFVSEDVILKKPVEKIKYLKGVYTGDPSLPEYNNEELAAKKRKNAQRYLDELGINDTVEFSVNEMNRVAFSLENHQIEAGERFIAVTPPSVPFDINATDEEIISFLKSDKYLSLLTVFSGVDFDKAFVSVRDEGSLEELEKTEEDEYYVFRTFTVCNKSDSPEQTAFDLAFNSISFWIVATKESLNKHEVSVYAKWMEDDYIVETTVDNSYFTTAKQQADDSIEAEVPNGYKIEDKDKATYRLVYDGSLKENYVIPCYQFFYPTDKTTFVATIQVPCFDISTLS